MSQLKREQTPPAEVSFSGSSLGLNMHFYQFHIGDYKSHTHHLSLIEDLAFRRLLDHYYLHEYPILQRDIARQIGMREHEQEVLTVLNEFFVSTEKGFVNPRADSQIKTFREHQAVSAWGAFCRDNPKIKEFAEKDVYIQRFSDGTHNEYISTLKTHHLPTMGTSSTHDATINQEPITNNHKPNKERATSVAMPNGISQSVWEDYKTLRKAKKAPVTQRVIDGMQEQADLAGWTLEKAMEECCIRGWQSFKAEWVTEKPKPFNRADIAHVTVPASSQRDPALVKLDEDRLKTAPPNPEVLARMRALLGRQA
jgi:uncharacterized protein YdaU (DUF1376 family)